MWTVNLLGVTQCSSSIPTRGAKKQEILGSLSELKTLAKLIVVPDGQRESPSKDIMAKLAIMRADVHDVRRPRSFFPSMRPFRC